VCHEETVLFTFVDLEAVVLPKSSYTFTVQRVNETLEENMSKVTLKFDPQTDAGSLDKQYCSETEEMLALKFTADFVAFLNRQNGGIPAKQFFKVGRKVKVVERFLCLYKDYEDRPEFGQFDIGVVWSQIEERLNDHLLPFAVVFSGDFLCFDYEDSEIPKIVLWDHDLSDTDEPVTTLVSDDFEEFLSLLTENKSGKV
jgi:SMI1-KNR4 cell-wall